MRKTIFVISILLILCLAQSSAAQLGKGQGPRFYSEFKPVVGGWSEYQMTAKGEEPSKMKIAVVGKEGDAYWYETVMEGEDEEQVISKMLVSGNPDDQQSVKRMIVIMGDEPAMEMPVQTLQGSKEQRQQKGKFIDKGNESIKVPAGTFMARHMQYQDGETVVDTWVHKEVSPYGMVKSQSKEFDMVLLGYGTGAKTLITETPQKFEMPQMPQMPQLPTKKK
jgi:hypothetical protein